jgi:amino acid transporter
MADSPKSGKLGTFAGVFTPTILTILGIILFLRLGYVVGGVGLGEALVIIALANLISVLTGLSIAGIATNFKVKAGGDYYVISRTLGLGFGGSIGFIQFLAQSISIGFYCIGFAEVVVAMVPDAAPWVTQTIAAGAVLCLFVLAWLGTDWATRFQYVVMALIFIALAAFAVGGAGQWSNAQLLENLAEPPSHVPFWVAFAVFFPAVTGFTQGVSMSGDLANPSRSIPVGTLSAIGLSIVVYFGAAVVLAACLPNVMLAHDYTAMKTVATYAPLIDAGVMAATLSSALASFLGGPRILQALAADKVFPFLSPFASGSGKTNNPRRAVALSGIVALATIALGSLNLIASIVAMFFLISYGLLNYATFYEARSASPSFRPTFRWFDHRLSLAGAVACLGAMLAIDLVSGITAVAVVLAIFQYLRFRAVPARWADSRRSYHLHQVREHLLAAAREPEHPRDWRPNLLVFSDDPQRRERILRFAAWIEGDAGLTTVVRVLEGTGPAALKAREEAADALAKELRGYGVPAFPLVLSVKDLQSAIPPLVQSAGVGPVRINTAVANWISGEHGLATSLSWAHFSENLLTAFRLGCNLLILDADGKEWDELAQRDPKSRFIDVWWSGRHTGRLMLLLAYLMTRSEDWERATIRVVVESTEVGDDDTPILDLETMLEEVRIDAEIVVADQPGADGLVQVSQEATVVFVPFSIHGGNFYHPFGGKIADILPPLPITVLTLAAQDINLAAEPEQGSAADAAAARDRLVRAVKLDERKQQEADKAEAAAATAEARLTEAQQAGEEQETLRTLEAAAAEAKQKVRAARRRADRAKAFRETIERQEDAES